MALHTPTVKSERLAQQSTSLRCLGIPPIAGTKKAYFILRDRIPRAGLLSVQGVSIERQNKERSMTVAPRKLCRTCSGLRGRAYE
jgi:hypothetical protein